MAEERNRVCPYCGGAFETNDSIVTCEHCGTVYHKGCWEINGGCAATDCPGHDSISKQTVPEYETAPIQGSAWEAQEPELHTMKKCQVCGTEMDASVVFCPGCGEKYDPAKENPQAHSGEIDPNQSQDTKRKRTPTLIIAIIAVVIVIAAGITTYIISNNNYEKYVSQINQFATETIDASANLETIGNEVSTYWNDYIFDNKLYYGYYSWQYINIYDTMEEAIAAAYVSVSTEVSQANKDHTNLTAQLEKLKEPPFTLKETDALVDKTSELYRRYDDLYDCVTDASGKNYYAFTSSFESTAGDVIEAYEDLDAKLK